MDGLELGGQGRFLGGQCVLLLPQSLEIHSGQLRRLGAQLLNGGVKGGQLLLIGAVGVLRTAQRGL